MIRAIGVVAMFAMVSVANASDCTRTSVGLVPLSDLGTGLYRGQFEGGLYPGGLNVPPAAQSAAANAAAQAIVAVDGAGLPSPGGRYVLLSIGMSNTTQEYCGGPVNACAAYSFAGQAAASPLVNHTSLAIVDGAAGGQTGSTWDSPTDANYDRVRDTRLAAMGLTEAQVQAAWVKVADAGPTAALPAANANAFQLKTELGGILRALRVRYPNIKIVFLSSRIYAGYASSTLNPEPYAYESAFACKWVIEAQINQRAGGGVDPIAGDLRPAVAPVVVWGPYLWADGLTPRSDGLVWACSDFNTDGTHPANPGREKVGAQLLQFFLGSSFGQPWFRSAGPTCDADYNNSGAVSVQDLFDFLADIFAHSPRADFNGSGGLSVQDLFDFLAAFFAGCE